MQRFAEQAARRLVYIVMTVAIAIPVWLATRPQAEMIAHDAAPLDLPATTGTLQPSVQARKRADEGPHTLVASLAPIPQRQPAALVLRFEEDSWLRVADGEGNTLEQALVRAGETRSYGTGEVASVVLGNGGAVEVRARGEAQDLAPYMRANVARFTVSSDGSLAPAAD
jgi:cytoskeleton protein RodZ